MKNFLKSKRFWWITLEILCFLLLCGATIYLVYYLTSQTKLDRVMDGLRQKGYGFTPEELRRIYPPSSPDTLKNLHDILSECDNIFYGTNDYADTFRKIRNSGYQADSSVIAAYRKFAAEHAELFKRFEAFVPNLKDLHLNHDWSRGYDMELPYLRSFLQLTQFYGIGAWLAFQEGNEAEALRCFDLISAITNFLLHDPVTMSFMSAVGFEYRNKWEIIREAATNPTVLAKISDATLKQLIAASEATENAITSGFHNAIVGETFMVSQLNDPKILKKYFKDKVPETGKIKFYLTTPQRNLERIDTLELYDAYRKNSLLDYRFKVHWGFLHIPSTPLNKHCDKQLNGILILLNRQRAWERSMRDALNLELYRRQHGKLPENPEDLSPDPFDDRNLRYRTGEIIYDKADQKDYTVKGFVVYSVGADEKDNNGDLRIYQPKSDYGFPIALP